MARGALDLEIAEPKVVLDADDPRLVRDVVEAKGDPAVKGAYQLVEEFMIAANEAVGSFFRKRNVPTVWRVHAPPDRGSRRAARRAARRVRHRGRRRSRDHAARHEGRARRDRRRSRARRRCRSCCSRTLTQAVWDTVPIGHFGLASGDYLHFTSPIRRYPDLLVHRLLKHQLHRDGSASGGGYGKPPPPPRRSPSSRAARARTSAARWRPSARRSRCTART